MGKPLAKRQGDRGGPLFQGPSGRKREKWLQKYHRQPKSDKKRRHVPPLVGIRGKVRGGRALDATSLSEVGDRLLS